MSPGGHGITRINTDGFNRSLTVPKHKRHAISDTLRQRQGDCVWYLPRNDDDSIFFLLMLEHQSGNDRMMALRLATYSALLYETLLSNKLISRKSHLPITLPIVLYSGVRRWSAPRSMGDLLDPAPQALQPYALQLRYLLVDEGELVRHATLPADNLAALLFRLEHNKGIDEAQDLVQTVWDRTHGPEYAEVRLAFTAYAKHVLLPLALPDVAIPAVENLLEIKTMLTEHSRSWTHQWKAEGRQEGRQEGISTVLHKQLQRKFGTLPSATQQQLKNATPAQLETWSLNVLEATTLAEVFTE